MIPVYSWGESAGWFTLHRSLTGHMAVLDVVMRKTPISTRNQTLAIQPVAHPLCWLSYQIFN